MVTAAPSRRLGVGTSPSGIKTALLATTALISLSDEKKAGSTQIDGLTVDFGARADLRDALMSQQSHSIAQHYGLIWDHE